MTTIIFEGYLGKIFGKKIKIHLGNLNKITDSIDCVKNGFRKKIIELSNKGQNYSIIKKDSNFYYVPMLAGAGFFRSFKRFFKKIFKAVVMIAIAAAIVYTGGLSMSLLATGGAISGSMSAAAVAATKAAFLGTFTIGGTTFSTLGVIASTLFSQGLSLLAQGVLSMVMGQSPQAIAEKNQRIEEHVHTGGAAQSTQVRSRSFLFSNDKNVGTQGNRIPIGYGRFTTSSNVIFVSLKNYDTNSSFQEQVKLNSEIEYN